jgi:hypothetical protein
MRKAYAIIFLFGALIVALIAVSRPDTTLAQLPPTATPSEFPTATITLTPTPLLTPLPTSAAPGCATSFPLRIGFPVTLRGGVNLRFGTSLSSPWLASFPEAREFTVVNGPVCSENYIWWQLHGHGVTGWAVESTTVQAFILFDEAVHARVDCPDPLSLVVGERINLVANVRVRNAPLVDGLTLTVAPAGSTAIVLDEEAVCGDGYRWRNVRVTVVNVVYDGWMAEGSSDVEQLYYLQLTPAPNCYPPRRMSVGERAVVYYRDDDYSPKNLRAQPNTTSAILYTLVKGVPLEIIGAPICYDGMNFWHVRVLSNIPAEGWLAEGSRYNYWIRPIRSDERYEIINNATDEP